MEKKETLMPIVKADEWLLPVNIDITQRYERFKNRLEEINSKYGSLSKFADAYNFLGIHYNKKEKVFTYREWAPAANEIFLFGDFNNWNRTSHPLYRIENGVWEIKLPYSEYKNTFVHNSKIKVLVNAANGWNERIPAYISRVGQDPGSPNFSGLVWLPEKAFDWAGDEFDAQSIGQPLIYEAHVGMAMEESKVGTYLEFADILLPRIKKAGYNTVQLMAIAEHPYYGSFGYHVANYFAVTSRSGTPEELKYLVRKAHSLGLAVIMDIVHSHTVKNLNEGIAEFDGTVAQYFHEGGRGHHPDWDSKLFNYGKIEVLEFLLSNVKYWIKEFHFDGFRFDGVSSMLYFHHGNGVNFDSPEKYFRDGVEFDAITYLQLANTLIHNLKKGAISIAEDVSGMPGISTPVSHGGLGFDYRLAMGIPDFWIKILKEEDDAKWNIERMYYEMLNRKWDVGTVAYAESHDQALVGDKTIAFRLMDKEMYFSMAKNTPNLAVDRGISLHKLIRLFTVALGGNAYLNFMGNEFGHPEWIDFPREGNNYSHFYARRQWSLCDNKELKYHYLADFDQKMVELVKEYKILEADYPTFLKHDDWHKTIAFERAGLIFVFNWHVNLSPFSYEIPVTEAGDYELVLNSDVPELGGFNRLNVWQTYHSYSIEEQNFIKVYVPNRTALVFKRVR